MTTEFADQLIVIEDTCNTSSDCHVIAGGDFNVDFSRHIDATLHYLKMSASPRVLALQLRHRNNDIDYTFHFNLDRFCILDHFLLSGSIYENSIRYSK